MLSQTDSSKLGSQFSFVTTVFSVSTQANGPRTLATSSCTRGPALIRSGRTSVIKWNENEPKQHRSKGSHFNAKILTSLDGSFCSIEDIRIGVNLWTRKSCSNLHSRPTLGGSKGVSFVRSITYHFVKNWPVGSASPQIEPISSPKMRPVTG